MKPPIFIQEIKHIFTNNFSINNKTYFPTNTIVTDTM